MRIIYNEQKKSRHKKGTIKTKRGKRVNIFDSIECRSADKKWYWWNHELNKWLTDIEYRELGCRVSSNCSKVTNVKQLVRHMKKHSSYLPKGTKFTLVSRFKGIKNIEGII